MPAHRKNIVSLSFCVSQTEPENLTLAIIFEWLVTLHISHVDSLWQDPPFFVPSSRSSFKVKDKYQWHIFQKMTITGALMFSKHSLLDLQLSSPVAKDVLTLYYTILTFNDPKKEAFWKHCGKRRKCW